VIPRVLSSKGLMTPYIAFHVQIACAMKIELTIRDLHQIVDLLTVLWVFLFY
jgi:hypothetical protein